MTALQRYPVGLQDLREVINNGYVYVDKTRYAFELMTTYKYYFLSRPRRFGKSLFVSTLDCIFTGQRELFKGLYIYDKWDFVEYPVIRISFSDIGYREIGLEIALHKKIQNIASQFGVILTNEPPSLMFKELIRVLQEIYDQQVVILIDEYDKPIIDYLDKEYLHKAIENRGILKSFYSVLKDSDPYLKMVFITGVSKFTQVSIFSDLNNLFDISLSPSYNAICGISQVELEEYFPKELETYDRDKIKHWYNGYRWDADEETVYNTFSILRFFSDRGKFQNFWFTTGTPTFVMEMSREHRFYDLANITANTLLLSSFDIENLEPIPILFQTGYLTIKHYDPLFQQYHLDYPNFEVRSAFLQYLTRSYMYSTINQAQTLPSDMLLALKKRDTEQLKSSINAAFTHIPYPLWEKENEHFYHAIIHLLFSLLGVYIHSEVNTKNGRADAIIIIEEGVFCLEFKLDKTAQQAIDQIQHKGYLDAYRDKGKPCHMIGINFSSKDKRVEEILWQVL